MKQLAFEFYMTEQKKSLPVRNSFSHEGLCPEDARLALEEQYGHLLEETNQFNRKLVSFQASKTQVLHSWFKYREGFSAALVEILIDQFGIEQGECILDPFAGSCTTLLVSKMLGINAVGVEMLPHCHLAWQAKSQAFEYDLNELRNLRKLITHQKPPATSQRFQHLRITQSAFPEENEYDLMAYRCWLEQLEVNVHTKILCRLILTSILEEISYTRKDGQYLRWDRRATKIINRNTKRIAQGKKAITGIYKGELPSVKEAFELALNKIITDVTTLQQETPPPAHHELKAGNTLYVLPTMEANQLAGVITSPPYANRYDYTRTYALELAYLGVGSEIFTLRQEQLSCTVENKSKLDNLRAFYHSIGQEKRYSDIIEIIQNNKALNEINSALQIRNKKGEINNRGVLSMIEQYFSELTFVFAELYRTCRQGAQVAFVNDNVRYAGEIIPVDLLSTNLAQQVGFEPVKVYVLPQRKGNSSQQMGRYGRAALRKSITIWRKP